MTTTTSIEEPLRRLADAPWKAIMTLGVASTVIGVLVLVWPGRSTLVAAVLFGIYLLVTGAAHLFLGLSAPMSGGTRALTLISGALSVVLGFICFRDRMQSVDLLAIWVGVGWIMSGLSRLFAMSIPGVHRGLLFLQGALLVVGGGVLIVYPIDSIITLVTLTGGLLALFGVLEIANGFQWRSRVHAVGAAVSEAAQHGR